ncbi:MAG: hypothetical protein E6Q97_20285 [Desulfurellales bacterium]|nr:MAG: hypothetical protein E6Q97_20285 [Desulfurellales bacterium]
MISAEEYRRRMNQIIAAEVAEINRTFAGTRPGRDAPARTSVNWTGVAGRSFIAYGLELDATVLPQHIEPLLLKLQEALYQLRNRTNNGEPRPVTVRLRYSPLALEVNHPAPEPLASGKANTQISSHTMLAGRNYTGGAPTEEIVSFNDTPHILVAGTTGSGKSTLLRMMVSTLALNTSPDDLRLYLVDLKNTDLKPFKPLPHKELFGGEEREAQQIIRIVHREVRRRKDAEDIDAPRIVLVIDELAEIADRDTLDLLSSILRVGRSFRVNVIAATQLPTKATCGEKNNYSVRFVGTLTSSQDAATAAGRPKTGAHLLPGKGAFLRVGGTMEPKRLQAYNLDMDGTAQLVSEAVTRWGRKAAVPVYQYENPAVSAPYHPVPQHVISGGTSGTSAVQAVQSVRSVPVAAGARFPIPDRPLTAAEAAAVRRMYAGGLPNGGRSKNSVITEVWGGLENKPKRLAWLDEAIEGGAA